MKLGRILLIAEEKAASRTTRRALASLGHTLVGGESKLSRGLAAAEEHGPDLVLIDARDYGERASLNLARQVQARFSIPSVLQENAPAQKDKSSRVDKDGAIGRVRVNRELASVLQLSLYRSALENEQKRATEQGARANQAEEALRNTARLVHQLNNLLSAIRCNAFLIQGDSRDRPELYEAACDTTTAVERCADIMTQLSLVVRGHGEPIPPGAAGSESKAKVNGNVRPRQGRSRGERSVLVVDDDPVVHRAVTRFLTSRGYRILAAATPGEALFIAQHEQIDVVISDLIMPEMTGYDLAARIKRLHPAAGVIYMSGYAPATLGTYAGGVSPASDTSRSGVTLLQKPFAVETLLRVLSAALGETEATAEQVTARIASASHDP